MMLPLFHVLIVAMTTLPPSIYASVPPKTPVLSGFEPAAIGSNRELVCDAFQPDAGTITYKWFKHSVDNGVEDWETRGNIGTSQKYVFNPVTETKYFHPSSVYPAKEVVSGKYKCRASNSAGTRDSEWGDLYVYTPCTRSLYNVSVTPTKPAIGDTFTLNCYIPHPSGLTVNWLRKADASSTAIGVAVANSKGCQAPSYPRYSWSSCSPPSISSPTKTFNLQVTNAQPADFAYWICKDISLSCDSTPVKPVVQAIPGTPQITGLITGPVMNGTQLNLKCVASPTGDTYDWYKNGTKVTTSLSYDFLVTKESAGVYKCVARNAVGSATSSNKTLVVYYKADSVVVSSGKNSSHVGEKDKFTCTVSGGYPTPNVTIYFKRSGAGTPVEVITQGQDKVMAKEDNQAEYYCEAKVTGYPALDMTSSKKTYNVTFPNTKVSFLNTPTAAVQVGQVKNFTCETDESNPITYMKWYQYIGSSWRDITSGISSSERNGAYGGKIRISEWSVTATKAMNGATVRCRSTYSQTGHGFAPNADTTMYVKWPATELRMVDKPSVAITAGVKVTIKCETDSSNSGSPGTISWYRNGQQITTGVTPSTKNDSDGGTIYISELTFPATKEDNQVKYECKINDQASFNKDVTITVNFPPKDIQLSTSITVKEGETKTITCSTTSSSNPAVSGISVKKRLGSSEVDVTGTSRVTNGAYHGKNVSIDIKLDTNRKDNGAQFICSFIYKSTTFTKTATVDVQFNPSKITMTQKPPTSINEDKSFNITCETDSANPVADITFHRNRTGGIWEQLTSGITPEDRPGEYNGKIRKSTLTVTANRLDTQAVFKCEVKEGSFQVEQTVTVNVYYPPTVSISSSPKPVNEGDTLTLACVANGGNPTEYTYKWFYKNKEIPNETSKDYEITSIKYDQSGTYRCNVTNYLPDGKADASLNIDVLYKAKWNPDLPEVFTVASRPDTPMQFVLHVIANPSPLAENVTWFFPNRTAISGVFVAAKLNDTTFTLNKTSVGVNDYGNYTVNVTNAVGISTFTFVLKKDGTPYTPCCLTLVNATAVSMTLTFISNFTGGSPQKFTIEKKTSPGGSEWDIAVKGIADPGTGSNVTQKISELDSDTEYEFRVKATNDDGDSGYGEILSAKTEAAPNATLTVERKDNQVTVSWPKLLKNYTRIQIKYCPKGGGSCDYHNVTDPTSLKSSFTVKEGNTYTYSMIIFDGEDLVFTGTSAPRNAPSPVTPPGTPVGQIAGGVGGVLFLLIIIAVVLVMKRRQAEKDAEILNTANNNGDANEGQVNPGFSDLDAGHSDVTDGFNPYEDSVEMTSPSSSIQIQAPAVAGGAEYAVVNKKGSKKPPVGDAYAEVDFKKKKAGKKGSAPPQPGGQAYAEVDFSKKSKGKGKGKAPVPSADPGGQAYAEVDFTKKAKKGEAPASSAGPGDVYAEVSKPKKPSKPGQSGSDDQGVYANVPNGDADEENLYEDVRKEEPIENGYRQPKEAYQVGVDGTIYSQLQISPPKNPDVIRGKDTTEEYASVDFSLQAPPLPEPEDPDDPNDPGFFVLL